MTAAPDDQLASAAATLREAQSLERRLAAAQVHARESATRAVGAKSRMEAEARDVDKLESASLTMIWAHLKGAYDSDLAREVAELQAADYEYRTQDSRAVADQRLVDHLTGQLAALGDAKATFERALAAKERWLRENEGPGAIRLLEMAGRRGQLTAELREVEQAHAAGERALHNLRTADDQLDSARSWSAYDTWFDGGLIASIVKGDKLDGVAASLRAADTDLKHFTTELADVHMEGIALVELGTFTSVFDVWFDNFFTDLMVRDRIIEAQEKVSQAITGVERILGGLDQRGQAGAAELNRLAAERAELLTS